jgi:hypothetical protein
MLRVTLQPFRKLASKEPTLVSDITYITSGYEGKHNTSDWKLQTLGAQTEAVKTLQTQCLERRPVTAAEIRASHGYSGYGLIAGARVPTYLMSNTSLLSDPEIVPALYK